MGLTGRFADAALERGAGLFHGSDGFTEHGLRA